jgi:hypothetical protein
MQLSHFAPRRTTLRSLVRPASLGCAFKPRKCLWLSCGDAWIDWLRDEDMAAMVGRLKYRYATRVARASLIDLATMADVQAFTRRFGRSYKTSGNDDAVIVIDWDAVRRSQPAKAGILLTARTMRAVKRRCLADFAVGHELSELAWASTFDVCSCAIWDPGALDGWEESPVVINRAQ